MIVASEPKAKIPAAVAWPACSRLESDDRADREEREVHEQVPEKHGREQPVGVVQQPGDDLLRPGTLRQLPELALRSENMAASLAEKKAEQNNRMAIVSRPGGA